MRQLKRSAAGQGSRSERPTFCFLEDRFRLASAASNDCLWEWDLTSGQIYRSEAMATRFGYSSAEVHNTSSWWRDRIHPEDRERACESIDRAIAEDATGSWTCEYRFRKRDGTYAEVCDRAYMLRDKLGQVTRIVGAVMDLSGIKEAYRALQKSEERYRYTIELTGQIAWSATPNGQVIQFDERWSSLTGLGCFITPADWEQVAHPDDLAKALEQWARSVETAQPLDFEHRIRVSDGTFRWFRSRAAAHKDSSGHVTRWYGIIEDINELKSSQMALRRLASHDDLTSLGNRHKFSAELEAALRHAADGRSVGLLVLDIDDFKSVNDLFGHDAGDLLLMSFARRMLDSNVEIYRTGGDEFAAIVDSCDGSETVLDVAQRIHSALEAPFHLGGTMLDCRISIGCAVFPLHGSDSNELLKSADIALYAAKAAGRGQTQLFASTMRTELQKRNSMLEVSRRALAADEISAFFQPKFRLRDGRLVGFEALMRIQNGRFGPQRPAVIGAAFDHPQLSLELADRMHTKILSIAKRWRAERLAFGRIAINASPLEFRGGKYAERLLSRLEAEGVPPEDIEVEVTETVFLEDDDSILQSLLILKNAGITVALDDFGTGYASLSHLRQYPVDALKIDRSFIQHLAVDARQELITKAVITLSQAMGIQTVAEGVETQEQADLLGSFGCDVGQGFLFRPAISAEDATVLLRSTGMASRMSPENELRAG